MPAYDYQCEACGRTYEVRQRISAPPLTACQFCRGPIRRLLASAPFILKGSGWHVSDYPSEARKKALASEKKTTEPPSSPSTTAPSSASDGSSSEGASSSTKD